MIISNWGLPWNWNGVSANINLTLSNIKANSHIPWNWFSISQNPGISIEDILKNDSIMSKFVLFELSMNHGNYDSRVIKLKQLKSELNMVNEISEKFSVNDDISLQMKRYL